MSNTNAKLQEMLSKRMQRFDGVTGMGTLRTAFKQALETDKAFHAKSVEIRNNKMLTSAGHVEKVREHVGQEAHRVFRLHKTVEKIKGKVAEREKAIQPKAPDPTNVAAYIRGSEYRQMLKNMPIGDKMKILLADNADSQLLAAALELPNFTTGINDATRQLVTEKLIEREHPGALAALERDRQALELLEVAVKVVKETAREVAEFSNSNELNNFLEKSVGDSAQLDADIDRQIASEAA